MEPIKNETINAIFHAPIETFADKWNEFNWTLLLKYVRENQVLRSKASTSNWTYFDRIKSRTSLMPNEFELVTINALNILARCMAKKPTNGLVYGEVQSGKTTSMLVLAALAFDLGFKSVVLLSGRINILRNQTQSRSQQTLSGDEFTVSPPPSTKVTPERKRKRPSSEYDLIDDGSDTESEDEYQDSTWNELGEAFDLNGSAIGSDDYMYWLTVGDKDVQNVKEINVDDLVRSTKLFAVLKKVPKSLESFVSFIEGDFDNSPWDRMRKNKQEIIERRLEIEDKLAEFRGGPALIIDDECDDASVAATLHQLNKLTGIPQRMIRMREVWPNSNGLDVCHYVGYSATPQANVLNNSDNEFFPHFFWELSTQNKLYLGSQMYLDEELKKRVIKLIPYEDYPNLNLENVIMPDEVTRGLSRIQTEFLTDLVTNKIATPSMKKFIAYYVFSGAIRLQRSRPPHDIDAVVKTLDGTTDPLSFFASDDELRSLHDALKESLDDSNEPYHSLSPRQLRNLFNNFNTNYSEMLYKPSFKQSIILAKIEELITNRIILYIAPDNTRFSTVTSLTGNESPNVYILHYKGKFYRLNQPLERPVPAKPLFHSGMVHASQSQDFMDLMYAVVNLAWGKVKEEIDLHVRNTKIEAYLTEAWNDLSPSATMDAYDSEIREVLDETRIKTAMCRGGESFTNMRTFDYSAVEGDRKSKSKPVPRFLIVIGGNMLSRGLTIEGLTVSWYTRSTIATVADTTIQHQRWFGWRNGYIDLVRVFMQERQLRIFQESVESEKCLRDVFRQMALNNWSPVRNSTVLLKPASGRITNKVKHNVEYVKVERFVELKTPALEPNASRAVLELTLNFWSEFSDRMKHHHAGDTVLNVSLEQVIEYLKTADCIGMPDASTMIGQIDIYLQFCEERYITPRFNLGIPTRAKINDEQLAEFTDEKSRLIINNKWGLHNRKRNAAVQTEFDQLIGAKDVNSTRDEHQYIDGIADTTHPLPEWLLSKNTSNSDFEEPSCRAADAPMLLLIYFLHPRFCARGKTPYAKNAREAGEVPLVALAGCFPSMKSRYVANATVNAKYVYPSTANMNNNNNHNNNIIVGVLPSQTNEAVAMEWGKIEDDDEDPMGRQSKRAKATVSNEI